MDPSSTENSGSVKSVTPPKRAPKPFNLFVYGTLMVPMVFRAVLGYRLVRHPSDANNEDIFLARDAVLSGYAKISPDGTYLYAVPDPAGKIRGYVVGPLPGESLSALRHYEGKNYRKVHVKVQTADGEVQAVAFIANLGQLEHSFGWRYGDQFKQEILLRRKIESALLEDEIARLHTDDELSRRALRELHGATVRDLVRRHFEAGGISTFAIRQAIQEEPLRDFSDAIRDPQAKPYVPNYLLWLVRQVMFNQIEERIQEEFRYDLSQLGIPANFYERAVSSVMALRMLNRRPALMDLLASDAIDELHLDQARMIDYVRWAVFAADQVYQTSDAQDELDFLQSHLVGGVIPLGCELEFSNTGHDVIRDPSGQLHRDVRYDGFVYFRDFALDILTWRLGGHVDDHHLKSSTKRRRGFFELALGSLSVEANISKPITSDPWLLEQFIKAAIEFYDVHPHSLHISLQLRSPNRPESNRPLPLDVMKCLFALGGDPMRGSDGVVRLLRLANEEIVRLSGEGVKRTSTPAAVPHMLFTQTSRRRSMEAEGSEPGSKGRWVQQFKFLRLSKSINYEPIAMALKGLQIQYKPGTFLMAPQLRTNPELGELAAELVRWGKNAHPLSRGAIEEFLGAVHDGLMVESRRKPAHEEDYIAHCLSELRQALERYNALFV